MLVSDFEIIITQPFPAPLMISPFGFYGDILELVYTTSSCGAMVSARSRKPAIQIQNCLSDIVCQVIVQHTLCILSVRRLPLRQ